MQTDIPMLKMLVLSMFLFYNTKDERWYACYVSGYLRYDGSHKEYISVQYQHVALRLSNLPLDINQFITLLLNEHVCSSFITKHMLQQVSETILEVDVYHYRHKQHLFVPHNQCIASDQ